MIYTNRGDMMGHKIIPVEKNAHLAAFIRVPRVIYRSDRNWVSPLKGEEYNLHNHQKHPFWQHARSKYFLAVDKGKLLGRIAGIIDPNFMEFHELNCGYWGFFDCIENQQIANNLFEAASEWLKKQGVEAAIGPMNPSTNYECGVLIAGFDSPPVVMMTYNHAYYDELILDAGLKKEKDLYAWLIDSPKVPTRLEKLAKYAMKRGNFTLRKLDFSKLNEEVELLLSVYNSAWERNWGFVPMTDAEFRNIARGLKQIADPDILFIAESDGKPVGFSITLPDLNQALIHNRGGRLLPFGILKILWHSKKISRARTIIMGVIEGYRNKGIDLAMYYRTFVEGVPKGYHSSECSWILEDNFQMNRILEDIGGKIYKTYRIYKIEL